MATFKVGQRVRVTHLSPAAMDESFGREGVIESQIGGNLHGDLYRISWPDYVGIFYAYELSPLLPPADSEWVASKLKELERLVREPKDLTPAQLDEVRAS